MPANMQSQQTLPRARVAPLSEQAKQTGISPSTEGFVQVSPMVGTFYAAAELDDVPLVKVGQRVSQGEVICIIEAMRMMNPIQAERDGVVSAIWAKDGDEVAFDQPLFTLI